MAKPKDRTEVEFLRGQNRDLQKQIKHLKKELGRMNKRARNVEDLEEIIREDDIGQGSPTVAVDAVRLCKKCQSNSLTVANLGVKTYLFCNDCRARELVK